MNPVMIIIFVIEICAKYYREILLSFNLRELSKALVETQFNVCLVISNC